jgi:hypothetical protein
MTLKGVGAMDVSSILNWKTTTQDFYVELYNPGGNVSRGDSNILVGLRNIRHHHHHHQLVRRLQQLPKGVENFKTNITYRGDAPTDTDNTLRYDQTIMYDQTTTENAPTAQELIQDPFKNDDLNREYTAELRQSDPLFSQLQEGVVVTAPSPTPTPGPPTTETPSEVNDDKLSTGAIVGIALGCAAVVGIGGYFIMGGSKSGDGHGGGSSGDYLPSTNEPPHTLSIDQGEEVSTMQDPVLGPPHHQGSSAISGEFGDQRYGFTDCLRVVWFCLYMDPFRFLTLACRLIPPSPPLVRIASQRLTTTTPRPMVEPTRRSYPMLEVQWARTREIQVVKLRRRRPQEPLSEPALIRERVARIPISRKKSLKSAHQLESLALSLVCNCVQSPYKQTTQ